MLASGKVRPLNGACGKSLPPPRWMTFPKASPAGVAHGGGPSRVSDLLAPEAALLPPKAAGKSQQDEAPHSVGTILCSLQQEAAWLQAVQALQRSWFSPRNCGPKAVGGHIQSTKRKSE